MDLKKLMSDTGYHLNQAKQKAVDHYDQKAIKIPKTGTGLHSPRSFGVGQPAAPTPRMAAGVGATKIISSLVHSALGDHVLPKLETSLQNLIANHKREQHIKKGGTFMSEPPISL